MPEAITAIDAPTLASLLQGPRPPLLIDVREAWEREIACVEGSLHVPLAEIPARCHEWDPDSAIALHCHHGMRSMHAAYYLAHQGFKRLFNLEGGIEAWSLRVDPDLARY